MVIYCGGEVSMKSNVHLFPALAKDRPILNCLYVRVASLEALVAEKDNDLHELWDCYADLYYEFNPEAKEELDREYQGNPENAQREIDQKREMRGWFVPLQPHAVTGGLKASEQSLEAYLNQRIKYLNEVCQKLTTERKEISDAFMQLYHECKPEEFQQMWDDCWRENRYSSE